MSNPTHLTVGPNESDNVEFGDILRQMREDVQLSRAEAASSMGFSSEYLRLIEHGKRTPALGVMRDFLGAYGVLSTVSERLLKFNEYEVEFTGRVLYARGQQLEPVTRNELIGQIVCLLVDADDHTLSKIYKRLRAGA